jgi:sortase A
MSRGDRIRWVLRGIGQVYITAGLLVLLFCVYELSFTSAYAHEQQDKLGKQLTQEWSSPTPPPLQGPSVPTSTLGKGFARIYFPTLGKDETHVVVEGVGKADLKKGPGHYPGTDLPGQLGNVVISGHRTTYGAPFNRLNELHSRDAIVIETRTGWFTYRVERIFVVKPTHVGVTYHVPDRPGVTPTRRLLTLTTCHPKYSAKQRLVVQAVLDSSLAKGPGVVPPALGAA